MKSGVNYGVDYTVYRGSPFSCHSEYCVVVVDNTSVGNINNTNNASGTDVELDDKACHDANDFGQAVSMSDISNHFSSSNGTSDASAPVDSSQLSWHRIMALSRVMPV